MNENTSNVKIESSSNKSFGLLFSVIFLIIAIYPLINKGTINYLFIFIAVIIFLISILLPAILTIPNKLWFKFSLILGSLISQIILTLIYLVIVTPTGFFVRLTGKDILNKKINKQLKSYWIKKSESFSSMKNQF